jgi:hypothetical protein
MTAENMIVLLASSRHQKYELAAVKILRLHPTDSEGSQRLLEG